MERSAFGTVSDAIAALDSNNYSQDHSQRPVDLVRDTKRKKTHQQNLILKNGTNLFLFFLSLILVFNDLFVDVSLKFRVN